jgi:hypothetical protein
MNFGVRPLDKVKLFTFINTILDHLIFHFASSGINLLFIGLSGFLQQPLGHLQDLFTLLGQILVILVEL